MRPHGPRHSPRLHANSVREVNQTPFGRRSTSTSNNHNLFISIGLRKSNSLPPLHFLRDIQFIFRYDRLPSEHDFGSEFAVELAVKWRISDRLIARDSINLNGDYSLRRGWLDRDFCLRNWFMTRLRLPTLVHINAFKIRNTLRAPSPRCQPRRRILSPTEHSLLTIFPPTIGAGSV